MVEGPLPIGRHLALNFADVMTPLPPLLPPRPWMLLVGRHLGHNFAHAEAPPPPAVPPQPLMPPPTQPPPMQPPATPSMGLWESATFLQTALLVLIALLVVVNLCCVAPLWWLRDRRFLDKVRSGRASRLTNVACCAPVLVYNSWAAYGRPCVTEYLTRSFDMLVCFPFRLVCCKWCCRFTDRKFPPKAASIGEWDGKSFKDDEVEWVRASELLAGNGGSNDVSVHAGSRFACKSSGARVKLFEGNIDPRDLAQGQVGDCWLIAAFACAAEYPGLITRIFRTKRANPRGKYRVRLYDWQAKAFTTLTIDDHLPTKDGAALFARPQGCEVWVALLEKAFAKFCGSYGALDGGSTAWALNALTGAPAFELRKGSDGTWERIDLTAKSDPANKRAVDLYARNPREAYSPGDAFLLLRRYTRQGALMGASFGSYGGGGGEGLNGEDMGPQVRCNARTPLVPWHRTDTSCGCLICRGWWRDTHTQFSMRSAFVRSVKALTARTARRLTV